jgi:hypothetical protein
VELFAVICIHHPEACAAKGKSPFQHRVEDGRKIPRRRIDDAEHFSSRRLLLQRLAGLGQQPRILHCAATASRS